MVRGIDMRVGLRSCSEFVRQARSVCARALLAVLAGLSCGQAVPEIRFAPEKDYGPFVFETPDGKVRGLSVDMLDAMRPLLDEPVTTLPAQPLTRILEAAQRGEVDLVSSLRPTPERSAYLTFSAPYVKVPAMLVLRQSSSPVRLVDLAGQRVAVGQGFAAEAFVRKVYPHILWQAVPDDLTALQGVLRGDYQAAVADIASVSFVVREHQLRGLQVGEAVGFEYSLSFAYRKELTAFGHQLQSALQRLDPRVRQQIMDRWIDDGTLRFENPRRLVLRWIGMALAVVAGALLFSVYWQRHRANLA